jgi:hypothetical protein
MDGVPLMWSPRFLLEGMVWMGNSERGHKDGSLDVSPVHVPSEGAPSRGSPQRVPKGVSCRGFLGVGLLERVCWKGSSRGFFGGGPLQGGH